MSNFILRHMGGMTARWYVRKILRAALAIDVVRFIGGGMHRSSNLKRRADS